MNSQNYWTYFLDTGAPEAYILYNIARRMEGENVSDDSGTCTADNGL